MRNSVFLAAIAIGIVLAASGCARHAAAAQDPPPVSITVAHVERRAIALTATLDGQVVPLQQSTLSFQQSGPITRVTVNVGDRVRAGQLLATIDDTTLSAQLEQDRAALAAAQSRLIQARANDASVFSTNSASLVSAEVAYNTAQLNLRRNQQLLGQGFVSQSTVDQAQQQFAAVQAQLRSAQIAEENTKLGSGDTTAAQADIKNMQAAVAQAQAAVDVVASQVAQTSLYAPFDGVVTERLMDPGAMASPSTSALQVSQIDTVYVNFNVPDNELGYTRPGTRVSFTTTSLPGQSFAGTIRSLNAVPSQGTLSYLAQIPEPNLGDLLRGGMLVTVTIVKARHANAIIVPRTAVAQTPNGNALFVVKGTRVQAVPVTLGLQTDTESEIRGSTISVGTEIVAIPPPTLHDGSAILVPSAPSAGVRVANHQRSATGQ